ncbi:alpha/beta fold hydrolase [Chryseobacterium sp. c4a]|uniref:alpha/beta fold hydrolase n=1 Tax=Chryseobacterium sp. c4a TaxID=1573582 RepID=UPI00135A4AB6|nr:alpha/beta hydrolase [Chryseobacterium sp. c4a]
MKQVAVFKSNDDQRKVLMQYNNSLSDFNGIVRQDMVDTGFGKTNVLSFGNDTHPKLVLLHGANSNAVSWVKDFTMYANEYKVYAIDIIGEPGKSEQNRLSYENENYSDWLNEVFQQLKIDKACLVGLSQGGWIAVKFAVKYPEKVKRLALLSPAGIVNTTGSFILKAVFYSLFGNFGKRKINELIIGNQKVDHQVLDFMELMQSAVNSRMDKEYIFSDEELKKLAMPVLFIGGAHDVVRDSEKIKTRLAGLLPDFEFFIDPEKGHVLVDMADVISEFLLKAKNK